ncbi:2-hydroxyacid dehydrogenase [Chitinibacter bivalviorum]|uniref:2-hydroxyacid dehydrogenase n=1 Tax=Chitinibacter bivalviorum TaxID=2739434 RepID=A0A7H9BLX7_9NEIS|nr:2-hydroxyacid dehydrogenase [Chitinibacter bivalviorum]QLG89603.1 2-hydroxyacid dehydrogenase [Chitinibacter bivalviorum]
MRVAVFDSKRFDRSTLEAANQLFGHELVFFEERLGAHTAPLAEDFDVVCPFVNDKLDHKTICRLAKLGVKLIALRCAGFNGVDLAAAAEFDIPVTRVPAYSPEAVAEHVFALLLTLSRKTHRAYNRVREGNFLLEGLEGFNIHGKTFGILGSGKIGLATARIARGFGCKVLAYDPYPPKNCDVDCTFLSQAEVMANSDILSLHTPLFESTYHMINASTLATMKPGVVILNTSRGGLIDTKAALAALKSGQIGGLGLDVYEHEEGVFFEDLSDSVLKDDILARLTTFPNVLITSHQGYLTGEALNNIAMTTFQNINDFAAGRPLINEVKVGA